MLNVLFAVRKEANYALNVILPRQGNRSDMKQNRKALRHREDMIENTQQDEKTVIVFNWHVRCAIWEAEPLEIEKDVNPIIIQHVIPT